MSSICGLVLTSLLTAAAFAQTPTFEVASVKRSDPTSVRNFGGGPGTREPGQITCTKATMNDLLADAFGVEFFQIAGPGWLSSEAETFDVRAKIPPGTTAAQAKIMMQNLLAARFRLVLHHESREFQGYELVVAKSGPKFKESVVVAPTPSVGRPDPLALDKQGFPQLPEGQPGMSTRFETGHARVTARQQPMSELADLLHSPAGRPVRDRTGLTGKYDFYLHFDWAMSAAEPQADSPPGIFTALEQQLGLKLESRKLPFDMLVIDHIERVPTEN